VNETLTVRADRSKDGINMESSDENQVQPDAHSTQRRNARRPLWQLAGAALLVAGLAGGGVAFSRSEGGSVAHASSSSAASKTAQAAPAPKGTPGVHRGFGQYAGRGMMVSVVSVNTTSTNTGTITATGRGSQTITITVTGSTKITKAGATIALAAIPKGARIAVQGTLGANRTTLAAQSIAVLPAGFAPHGGSGHGTWGKGPGKGTKAHPSPTATSTPSA
jgi:hypothetical protein